MEGLYGRDAPYLHRADRSDAAGDPHSLEVAAGGQAACLRVFNMPFIAIRRQPNHATDDYWSPNTAVVVV